MPQARIRPARPEDAPRLAELSGQLGYPASAAQFARRLNALGEPRDHAVLVAETEGPLAGFLHVCRRRVLESEPFAEIQALVVEAQARGRGVGTALVQAAERWAKEQGLGAIRVRSNVVRARTHAFYLRAGFALTKTQHVFAKPLERDQRSTSSSMPDE